MTNDIQIGDVVYDDKGFGPLIVTNFYVPAAGIPYATVSYKGVLTGIPVKELTTVCPEMRFDD